MKKIDVFIKDEGDFITIGFNSFKAQSVILNERNEYIKNVLYGNKIKKIDLDIKSKHAIITYLVSHHLSWEEC